MASFILSLTWEWPLLWFFMAGFLFLNKKVFFEALCLMASCVPMTFWLKGVFKFPPPTGGAYWSFPSTQMTIATLFFGYILLKTRHWQIKLACSLLIGSVGFSLYRLGYHHMIDLGGAIAFSIPILMLFKFATEKFDMRYIASALLAIAILFALATPKIMQSGFLTPSLGIISGAWLSSFFLAWDDDADTKLSFPQLVIIAILSYPVFNFQNHYTYLITPFLIICVSNFTKRRFAHA